MNFKTEHDFKTRNITVVEPEEKIIKNAFGAFEIETKNGKILYEYSVLPNFEDFDDENMCSFGLGTVAYGNIEEE